MKEKNKNLAVGDKLYVYPGYYSNDFNIYQKGDLVTQGKKLYLIEVKEIKEIKVEISNP